MDFWLGTDRSHWLATAGIGLMVSNRVLNPRRSLPVAASPWVLDSGGFTELSMHGSWDAVSPPAYVAAIRRYQAEIGSLAWAAPQDWMCEPFITAKTGLTVEEHLRRTVGNYLDLRSLDPTLPIIPVVQGFDRADYHRCLDLYEAAGVDLPAERVVGIGSVCRRQATSEAATIIRSVTDRGIRLHGFGLKLGAIDRLHGDLESADSMAWSYGARLADPLPGCPHKHCNHCLRFALRWREKVLRRSSVPTLFDKATEAA